MEDSSLRIRSANSMRLRAGLAACFLAMSACRGPIVPGPDRQFAGTASGAALGAGTGAVTGFQVSAATGPGAAVGAGLGAVAGAITGAVRDSQEDDLMHLSAEAKTERERAYVHQLLQDHYQRRLELHPSRDIFPADMFFVGDHTKLCHSGELLVAEIARLNGERMPWSRLVVAVYSKAKDSSDFARHLAEERARSIADQLAKSGINPRRLETQPMIVDAPVLIDPLDDPQRYSQAVELILHDK